MKQAEYEQLIADELAEYEAIGISQDELEAEEFVFWHNPTR